MMHLKSQNQTLALLLSTTAIACLTLPTQAQTLPDASTVPATTPIAPTTTPESSPATELPPARNPEAPMKPATIPTLPSNPAPYSAPTAGESGPGGTVPTASTMVLPQETLTGIKTVSLPAPLPVRPIYFTLPIQVEVMKDSSITSNNPISDKNTSDIQAWAAAVQGCLQQKPMLIRVVGDKNVPFMIDGREGTIKINASDRAVCAA